MRTNPTDNQDKPDVSKEQPKTTQPEQLSDNELQQISGGVRSESTRSSGHEGWIE
jgi:bacteriocin-like protein